jgi:mRNA interferase MazF
MVTAPAPYIPERGDVVYLDFDPQAGREQKGRRPALVLSPISYNRRVGLCVACPITGQVKGYPFEVAIPSGQKVTGVILADQVKSLDWQARNASFLDRLPQAVIADVLAKIDVLLR